MVCNLSQEHEGDIAGGVGLSEHSCRCLYEYLVFGELGALRGDIHIHYPA